MRKVSISITTVRRLEENNPVTILSVYKVINALNLLYYNKIGRPIEINVEFELT